ncbi:MAG: DnaA/Hda family protein [candidate division WOR-3 bacterium]|nr:DnaA/Hda family protein [candidate division WOR-3 bacterium]
MMKKNFGFENFYVYEGNKVAFIAAKKIVQFPGEIFNPFYIYASGSYGKTYFLWTIYNELSKKEPVLIFTPKEFEEYLQKNTQFDSAILVDDINRVNDKFQDAILTMIDVLITRNKQMCFSGNVPPRELKNLGSKVISRLEGGLVCDLQAPHEIALVEFIKKKSEERGIIIPDEIALELTQLSGGSLRTIDGMLNRLVAYASLGTFTFDLNTIRLILKEFYPRGVYSPVSSLVEELKKSADEVLSEIAEVKDPRTEYKEKIYIWEMKGFDTSELKPLLDGDIETLIAGYNTFIKKVERLIELQKEFGTLDVSKFPEEAMKIETMLFSPDKISEIETLIDSIKRRLKAETRPRFEGFIISDCNRTAIELYEKTILPAFGKEFNPYIILGNAGTGKTFLCQKIADDLRQSGFSPLIFDFEENLENFLEEINRPDALLVDNFHKLFTAREELRKMVTEKIFELVKQEVGVIIFSEPLGDINLTESEKILLRSGIEATLKDPDDAIVELYLKSKLSIEEFDGVKKTGIPRFQNFKEIDAFITDLRTSVAPVIEEGPKEEFIMLGLPGEEEIQVAAEAKDVEHVVEVTQVIEPGVKTVEPKVEVSLKKFKENCLIIQEIQDELIEENYITMRKGD